MKRSHIYHLKFKSTNNIKISSNSLHVIKRKSDLLNQSASYIACLGFLVIELAKDAIVHLLEMPPNRVQYCLGIFKIVLCET